MIILVNYKEITMEQKDFLFFTSSLLDKLHVTSHIFESDVNAIPKSMDNGLRAIIYEEEDYTKILSQFPLEPKDNVIYRFFDEYQCYYVFLKFQTKIKILRPVPIYENFLKESF